MGKFDHFALAAILVALGVSAVGSTWYSTRMPQPSIQKVQYQLPKDFEPKELRDNLESRLPGAAIARISIYQESDYVYGQTFVPAKNLPSLENFLYEAQVFRFIDDRIKVQFPSVFTVNYELFCRPDNVGRADYSASVNVTLNRLDSLARHLQKVADRYPDNFTELMQR